MKSKHDLAAELAAIFDEALAPLHPMERARRLRNAECIVAESQRRREAQDRVLEGVLYIYPPRSAD